MPNLAPSMPSAPMGAVPGTASPVASGGGTPIPQLPGSGGTNTSNPSAGVAGNPYVPTLTLPGNSNPGISTTNGDYTVAGDFTQTYGQGTGTAIINTLAGLGTTTDSAIQATANQSYNQAQKTAAGIISGQAQAGISRDSSASALAQGDFWSGYQDSLNSTIAGMEQNQENTLLSTLMTEGQAHGGDVSTWDNVLEGLGDGAAVAGSFFTGNAPSFGGSKNSNSSSYESEGMGALPVPDMTF